MKPLMVSSSFSECRYESRLTFLTEDDWNFPQNVTEDSLRTSLQAQYGFLDMHSGFLNHATYTENEVNELGDEAEICTKAERRERRMKHEDEKFDEEHYV